MFGSSSREALDQDPAFSFQGLLPSCTEHCTIQRDTHGTMKEEGSSHSIEKGSRDPSRVKKPWKNIAEYYALTWEDYRLLLSPANEGMVQGGPTT